MIEPHSKMLVNDIYPAIVGEGLTAGQPCTLVRLFGTNFVNQLDLHTYASDPTHENKDSNARNIFVDDVIEEILGKKGGVKNHLLIVGGEPLVQQEALVLLIRRYKEKQPKAFIEVATNGLTQPLPELDDLVDRFIVSVPLANATRSRDKSGTFSTRVKGKVLEFFAKRRGVSFIFHLDNIEQVSEVTEIEKSVKIPRHKMWLTYASTNHMEVRRNTPSIVDYCAMNGYNYSPRIHVSVFNGQRGK